MNNKCIKSSAVKKKEELSEYIKKNDIDDKIINEIYNKVVKTKNNLKQTIKLSKDDSKYIILLDFINDILKTMGKKAVTDINQFNNIERDNIIKQNCVDVMNSKYDKIVALYGKTSIHYRFRYTTKDYILSLLRSMTKVCGYQLKSEKKFDTVTVGKYTQKKIPKIIYFIL